MPISIIRICVLSPVAMNWLDDGREAERREHGGQAEQHRDAGGQQRAEGDDQDDQRDRDGQELGLLEVRRRACRRTPCRTTRRRTARRAAPGGGRRWWTVAASIGATLADGVVGVAADLELDHAPSGRRRSAAGRVICADVGELAERASSRRRRRLLERLVGERAGAALDEHHLGAGLVVEAGRRRSSSSRGRTRRCRARESSIVVVPTALPTKKQTATNATQPRIARQGCRPLQRPMRWARLRGVVRDSIRRDLRFGADVNLRRPDGPLVALATDPGQPCDGSALVLRRPVAVPRDDGCVARCPARIDAPTSTAPAS